MIPVPSTKDRILDSAERLFADLGFDATSLRLITSDAEVNLAAVNYHFQSKESLLDAVIERRLVPLNLRRLELLDQYQAEAPGQVAPIEQVLDALLRPILEAGPHMPRLIVRFQYLEANDMFQRIFQKHLRPIFDRFGPAMLMAVPHVPPAEAFLRALFVMGAFSQMLIGSKSLQVITQGRFQSPPPEAALQSLIHFAAAGFNSPALQVTHVSK
jgi:AcrR family transcriptional regulator